MMLSLLLLSLLFALLEAEDVMQALQLECVEDQIGSPNYVEDFALLGSYLGISIEVVQCYPSGCNGCCPGNPYHNRDCRCIGNAPSGFTCEALENELGSDSGFYIERNVTESAAVSYDKILSVSEFADAEHCSEEGCRRMLSEIDASENEETTLPEERSAAEPTNADTASPSNPTTADVIVKVKGFHGRLLQVLDNGIIESQPDVDFDLLAFERQVTPITGRLLSKQGN